MFVTLILLYIELNEQYEDLLADPNAVIQRGEVCGG